jgi:hypothetical protein
MERKEKRESSELGDDTLILSPRSSLFLSILGSP